MRWLKKGVRLYDGDHFLGWRCQRCGEVYSKLEELGGDEPTYCPKCRDDETFPTIEFSKERMVFNEEPHIFEPGEPA